MKNKFVIYCSTNIPTFNENEYLYQIVKSRILTDIPHAHDFFEIICVLRGSAIHNIDGNNISMQALDFTILSPNNIHYFIKQSNDLELFSLSILPSKFTKFLSTYELSFQYGKNYKITNSYFTKEIYRLPSFPPKKQRLIINTILGYLLSEVIISDPLDSSSIPFNLQVALEKFRRPEYIIGGVKTLAELVGYSQCHLERLIKKYFNKKPIQLIQELRMQLAAEYLRNTSFTIEQIAENIGLASLSQFHSAFKKYFNCTPHRYRATHRTKQEIVKKSN